MPRTKYWKKIGDKCRRMSRKPGRCYENNLEKNSRKRCFQ
jgi:hypothetical protein